MVLLERTGDGEQVRKSEDVLTKRKCGGSCRRRGVQKQMTLKSETEKSEKTLPPPPHENKPSLVLTWKLKHAAT